MIHRDNLFQLFQAVHITDLIHELHAVEHKMSFMSTNMNFEIIISMHIYPCLPDEGFGNCEDCPDKPGRVSDDQRF